jgi:hypothetical protein
MAALWDREYEDSLELSPLMSPTEADPGVQAGKPTRRWHMLHGAGFSLVFLVLLLCHAFLASWLHPIYSLTCASSLADCAPAGCASAIAQPVDLHAGVAHLGSGNAPHRILVRCPPRCSDFWDDPKLFAVYGGANGTYRGDSKLCRAAMQAGMVSSWWGGAAALTATAPQPFYHGIAANSVHSLDGGFYPFSLSFSSVDLSACVSLQWVLAAWMVLGWITGELLGRPRAHTWIVMMIEGYWYLVFTARGGEPVDLLLWGLQWLPPAAALGVCVWIVAARPTLLLSERTSLLLPAPSGVSKRAFFLLYAMPFVLLLHMNFATAVVPDTSIDSAALARPASIIMLAAIISIVAFVLFYHARLIWQSSLCNRFLWTYGALIAALALCWGLASAHASPHLHHSLLALTLLPLTRFPGRLPMVAQGAFLGVLINGITFWGLSPPFDPAPARMPVPTLAPNITADAAGQLSFSWPALSMQGPTPNQFGLVINGLLTYVGWEPSARVAAPLGALFEASLAFVGPDGTLGPLGPAISNMPT